MVIDVRPILHTPGKRLDFRFDLDLSDLEFDGRYPVSRPVTVEGEVRNTADLLELALTAETTLDAVCDRCGKEFSREKTVVLDSLAAQELEDEENDDILLLEGAELDLDEAAATAFILAMDTKNLCSDDCKGLCAKCGADLNLGPCGCGPDVDPRLAALAQLLDKEAE